MAAAVSMAAASVSARTTSSSFSRSEFSGLRLPQQRRSAGNGALGAKAAFLPAQKQQLRRKSPTQALYIQVTPGCGPMFRPYRGGFGPFGPSPFRYSQGPFSPFGYGPSPFGYGNPFGYGYGYGYPRRGGSGGAGLLTLAPFLLYLASVAAPHFARWMQSQQSHRHADREGVNKEGESTSSASTSYADEEEAAWERRFAAGVRTESTDTGAAYRFRVELPGYERGDIKVQVVENMLIVTAAKQGEAGRVVGKVERKFRLAKNVEVARTSAACENGVLIVTVPKTKDSQAVEVDIQ